MSADKKPRGAEWAMTIESVSADGHILTVRDATPLREPVTDFFSAAGAKVAPVGDSPFVFFGASQVLRQMSARRESTAALRLIDDASPEDWKQALLKLTDKLSPGQRAILTTLAQSNALAVDHDVLAKACGVESAKEFEKLFAQADRLLALALGARKVGAFWQVIYEEPVEYDSDHENGGRTLRRELAQALLDLRWVSRIGDLHFGRSAQENQVSNLRLAAAEREVAEDPQAMNESATVRQALVQARIGQGRYRERMLRLWQNRCALTGAATLKVLVASHALSWSKSDNAQRLDPYNGLLLAASVDRLFDEGLISFAENGTLLKVNSLKEEDLQVLGIKKGARLRFVAPQHLPYLRGHREQFGFE